MMKSPTDKFAPLVGKSIQYIGKQTSLSWYKRYLVVDYRNATSKIDAAIAITDDYGDIYWILEPDFRFSKDANDLIGKYISYCGFGKNFTRGKRYKVAALHIKGEDEPWKVTIKNDFGIFIKIPDSDFITLYQSDEEGEMSKYQIGQTVVFIRNTSYYRGMTNNREYKIAKIYASSDNDKIIVVDNYGEFQILDEGDFQVAAPTSDLAESGMTSPVKAKAQEDLSTLTMIKNTYTSTFKTLVAGAFEEYRTYLMNRFTEAFQKDERSTTTQSPVEYCIRNFNSMNEKAQNAFLTMSCEYLNAMGFTYETSEDKETWEVEFCSTNTKGA